MTDATMPYFFHVSYLFDLVYEDGRKHNMMPSYGSLRFHRSKRDVSNSEEFQQIYNACMNFGEQEKAKFPPGTKVANLVILNIQCLGESNEPNI